MTGNDKRHFCISIAGHTAGIDALYDRVYSMCENYLCDELPELHICIEEEDIAVERAEAEKTQGSRRDDYLETLAVYRKISEEMLSFDTFLMHGAVVAIGNSAYMFIADSGTGKTTHIKKWIENADGAFVVNGDKPLVKITDTQVLACGTPWCGKEQWSTNTMVPLKAIVSMERSEDNAVEEVSFGKAFTSLLQQTYWPEDADKMKKTLSLLSKMKGKVRFYRYHFNNYKEDAFDVSYKVLTGR